MASLKQKKYFIMECLPTDLLLEIFSRLPCKDIVVCKRVCRAWYNLLSHPSFSKFYAENPRFTSVLLFKHRCFDHTSYAFLVEIATDGGVIKTPLTTNIPNFHSSPRLTTTEVCDSYIIGSCNGLLFFYQSSRATDDYDEFQRVYCYNPFSGECILLAQRRWSLWPDLWPVQYRVGYISSTGYIKLLAFVNSSTQPVRILTVGIDRTWRRLEDPFDRHFMLHGVSFNGVYHWINGNTYPTCLKTFDFREEKNGPEWKLPRDLAQDTLIIRLAVLNNHISMIENLHNLVIWTMEEYGVAESWSRKMVIGDYCPPFFKATLTNGDLLFSNEYGDGVTIVNLKKEDPKKEDTTIDVYNCTTNTGILYVAEFAPKFSSLENIQNF